MQMFKLAIEEKTEEEGWRSLGRFSRRTAYAVDLNDDLYGLFSKTWIWIQKQQSEIETFSLHLNLLQK